MLSLSQKSVMDNFNKLFQAELKGNVHNIHIFSSITVILLFLVNLLPK